MKFTSWFLGLAILTCANFVHAHTPVLLNGTDVGPAVEFFAPMVTPLTKSVTIYSWSPKSSAPGASLNTEFARVRSGRFWHRYGSPDGSNDMYGTGLYGASDPAVTEGYGGGGDDWTLLVMKLPVGFRMLDIGRMGSVAPPLLPAGVSAILSKFGCPVASSPDSLFTNGGVSLSKTCQSLVKEIFSNQLNIDGFAYSYSMTQYKACSNDWTNSYRAFVLTNDEWMNDSTVHYYTRDSKENSDERVTIQTLLLEAGATQLDTSGLFTPISTYLVQHPDAELVSSSDLCSGSTCVISVHLCDTKNVCGDVALAPIARPGGPTLTPTPSQPILWQDLNGHAKSSTTANYLLSTDFGCDGTLPYNVNH